MWGAMQGLDKFFDRVSYAKYSLSEGEWEQIQVCISVLAPFKSLSLQMVKEGTPTINFTVPRFNVLSRTLQSFIEKGGAPWINEPMSQSSCSLRIYKAKAAHAALKKIDAYYKMHVKIPAFAIATGLLQVFFRFVECCIVVSGIC